jgi:multisubunit Na+/H+ antiporter MnhB subunit
LPNFGSPVFASTPQAASQTYIEEGFEKTGAANIVAAVVLDYRAYDTLGEATVLFSAILGAVVILRKKSRNLPEAQL